ncbi:MAG: glycosyl hydrolase [Thermoguttaceae bacterium]
MDVFTLLGTLLTGALIWVPANVSQFWVEPDKPALFEFEVEQDGLEGQTPGAPVKFVVRSTDGDLVQDGQGVVHGDRLEITTTLPQGYFELEIPETTQAFGVASQPAYCPEDATLASEAKKRTDLRPRDGFFAIDSASTWLLRSDKTREDLIRNARRIGLSVCRERINWKTTEPQEGAIDYNRDSNAEILRQTSEKYDVPVLELFHNAPDWTGRIGTYPEDLMKTAISWGKIGERWNRYWHSIEVWNEPDIHFSGDMPADQYAPVLKTVAQEFQRKGIKTPIVGGVIAVFRDEFMDCLADNDGIAACDVFSFHTYCRAPEMEAVCLRYHNWLVKNNAAWKPVWITECGRPWKKGTARPDREADLESAIDIVQKGVVTKAIGYDSYFPFVYVYYEENENNFGMCDRNSAPLRSIAGYARMIYLLSGKECVGSWKVDEVESSWLFKDPETGEQVAVLYTSQRDAARSVRLPCNPEFVERITGERLGVGDDNLVDFADGFLFVGLPGDYTAPLREASDVDRARELRREARDDHGIDARENFDVVARFDFDGDVLSAANGGYSLKDSNVKEFTGSISVYNFSDEAKTLSVDASATIEIDGAMEEGAMEEIDVVKAIPELINVDASGRSAFPFTIDLTNVSPLYPPKLTFKIGDVERLSFKLFRAFTEENFHESVNKAVRVDLSDSSEWIKSSSLNGTIEFNSGLSTNEMQGWGFDIKYSDDSDSWCYPRFTLPKIDGQLKPSADADQTYDLSELKGVAFRVKGASNAAGGVLRFFAYGENGTYFTAAGFAPADGNERFVVLPFKELDAYGGTTARLSPDRIDSISIGGNSKGSEMKVEVGDFYFFK